MTYPAEQQRYALKARGEGGVRACAAKKIGDGLGMIRTIFLALGVLFAAVIAFSAGFLGNLSNEISGQTQANEQLAVAITRQLSQTWALKDVKSLYAKAVIDEIDATAAQKLLDRYHCLQT